MSKVKEAGDVKCVVAAFCSSYYSSVYAYITG